jgi:hypothetical protein
MTNGFGWVTTGAGCWSSVAAVAHDRSRTDDEEAHTMTAGQGGPGWQPPEQGGPPQGWNAPPAAAPYGQQYGQQHPGYGPAPSAPTGYGAPPALERPVTVRAGIGAFVGSIVLSVVGQVITALNWDTVFASELDASLGDLSGDEADIAAGIMDSFGVFALVIGLVFTAVFALFVWFAWRGHNWARIILWVLAGIGVAFGLLGVAAGSPLPVLAALGAFELLFDIVAIVLLALKPSNEWYRFRSWQRATGQG